MSDDSLRRIVAQTPWFIAVEVASSFN